MTKSIKNLSAVVVMTLLLAMTMTPVALASNGDAPPSVENPFGSGDEDTNEDPAPEDETPDDDTTEDETVVEDETTTDDSTEENEAPPALTLGGSTDNDEASQSNSNDVIAANTAETLPNSLPATGPAILGLLAVGSIAGGIKVARRK